MVFRERSGGCIGYIGPADKLIPFYQTGSLNRHFRLTGLRVLVRNSCTEVTVVVITDIFVLISHYKLHAAVLSSSIGVNTCPAVLTACGSGTGTAHDRDFLGIHILTPAFYCRTRIGRIELRTRIEHNSGLKCHICRINIPHFIDHPCAVIHLTHIHIHAAVRLEEITLRLKRNSKVLLRRSGIHHHPSIRIGRCYKRLTTTPRRAFQTIYAQRVDVLELRNGCTRGIQSNSSTTVYIRIVLTYIVICTIIRRNVHPAGFVNLR